jgi:hypothetical protein
MNDLQGENLKVDRLSPLTFLMPAILASGVIWLCVWLSHLPLR